MTIEQNKTATADGEDVRAMIAEQLAEKREAVAKWNDLVDAYRAKTTQPIPLRVLVDHPAHGDLVSLILAIRPRMGFDKAEVWVSELLSKLSHDDDGNLLCFGKGRELVTAWADSAQRAAKVAAANFMPEEAALYDQSCQIAGYLEVLLWEDAASETPMAVALREAKYV